MAAAWLILPLQAAAAPSAEAPKFAALQFDRDIRPILSENCYACHGPDDGKRKAKLRLDRKEDAFKTLPNGEVAIVPGKPEASKLVDRISSQDEDEVMPPVKTGKKLTSLQIELLRRWIAQGAQWQSHWAFVPPQRSDLPTVKDQGWVRNPIDRFILARLEHEGLTPAPEAEKTTLIRRASLDLTGLPPTLDQVDAFVVDTSPDAFEKLVDRLLQSPRYGEHLARYWLDAVRYADSHGYHIDFDRDIWAYRDWVIHAFNCNMPFDQFTVEQLAGDLLPNPSVQQRVASGYNRCRMSSNEGGAIEEEFQAKAMFDRAETTATVWLGLTFTCARCHNHKFDPLPQREYYAFSAFFNNFDEPVFDSNVRNTEPYLKLPTAEQTHRQEWLRKQVTDGQAKLQAVAPQFRSEEDSWAEQWHNRLSTWWTPIKPETVSCNDTNLESSSIQPDGSFHLQTLATGREVAYKLTAKLEPGSLAGLQLELLPTDSPSNEPNPAAGLAFLLSELEADIIPTGQTNSAQKLKFIQAQADTFGAEHEPGKAIDGNLETSWGVASESAGQGHRAVFRLASPVKIETESRLRVCLHSTPSKSGGLAGRLRLAAAQKDELVQLLSGADPWQVIGPLKNESLLEGLNSTYEPERHIDLARKYPGAFEEVGWEAKPEFDDGRPHALVYDVYSQHGNGVYYLYRTLNLQAPCRARLSLRADELFKAWINDRMVALRSTPEKPGDGFLKIDVDLQAGENRILLKVVNYEDRLCYFNYSLDLEDIDRLPPDIACMLLATSRPTPDGEPKLRDYYGRHRSSEFRQLYDSVEGWRYEDKAIEKTIATTLVSKELPAPRETYVLSRGEYDRKGEKVAPNVPSILPPFPKDAPTNRLGLARWLTAPGHPLTARVVVNRLWQQCFGTGLVKTAEDFGIQGERPSHPELLDWLACEFVDSGWDVKHMERLILSSATYQQSSRSTVELNARDPENRLLARGPRFRVDAEVVRDTALCVSGLLVEQTGGPSVKPYEPPGLWEAVSHDNRQRYVPDIDQREYRRSLYTFWKRQSPPPNMLIFDAPTRESCLVRRARTTTPLQALVLLNDPQFVEASRAFAQRVMLEPGAGPENRIRRAFRLATARTPDRDETQILRRILERQTARFQSDPDAAKEFLHVGNFKPDPGLDPRELAAWTTVASVVLNLDETITKD